MSPSPDESAPARACDRCGADLVRLVILGHERLRCPADPCERARRHRREQQAASARRIEHGPTKTPARRRSVAELTRYFSEWDGEGFQRGLREAMDLLDVGADWEEAADWVGWTVPELRDAVERKRGESGVGNAGAAPNVGDDSTAAERRVA